MRFFLFICTILHADPLPSWNSGPNKEAILSFVCNASKPGSPHYIPPAERIATFDQDGTLWVEQPQYTQVVYCLDRAGKGAEDKDLKEVVRQTLSGMSVETFYRDVRLWLSSARHPRWNRPYTELVYQPMLEVMRYLEDNGFRNYIVTGSGQDFVRTYSVQTYGIDPERVIGTAGQTRFESKGALLMKEPELLLNDNYGGKPEGIHLMIGRRPRAAFGNSTGDQQMLEYANGLRMLVLHDDAEREYAYGPACGLPPSKIGTFTQALYDQSCMQGWHVISIKRDWRRIFSFE